MAAEIAACRGAVTVSVSVEAFVGNIGSELGFGLIEFSCAPAIKQLEVCQYVQRIPAYSVGKLGCISHGGKYEL